MYCDSGLGGRAALCREAGHDTAMPVRTHVHDTGAGRRCWACRALGGRVQGAQAIGGHWALGGLDAWRKCTRQASGSRRRRRRAQSAGSKRQRRAGRAECAGTAGAGPHRRGWGAGAAGWAACAHKLGQVGCFGAPDSVFGLVRLSIVRESLNEHCSLQNKF